MKKLILLLVLMTVIAISGCIKQTFNIGNTETTTTISLIPSFTDSDLNQGWYYGSINQKKPGTPENWLHSAEGTRSAKWFNPIIGNENICSAITRTSESIEKDISKFCNSNDDCESKEYVDSLTNAVKCFNKNDLSLSDYDYAFDLYRKLDCPLNMGGAPYSKVYCECSNSICTAILVK
jgi:hypothetical protein